MSKTKVSTKTKRVVYHLVGLFLCFILSWYVGNGLAWAYFKWHLG